MANSKQPGIVIYTISLMFRSFLAKVFEDNPDDIPTDPEHLKPLRDSFAAGAIAILNNTAYLTANGCDMELLNDTWNLWKSQADAMIDEEV